MPDDPVERTVKQYIANGATEGAMSAAQRLSEAVGVGLNEVLAAVQKLGPWEAGATIAGEATVTAGATVIAHAGAATAVAAVGLADVGTGVDSLTVVRIDEVDDLRTQAQRGGLANRLTTNQRMIVAVILIAAVFPVLPPAAQKAILEDATLVAAIAAVLALLRR